MGELALRAATVADRERIARALVESWGSATVVAHGANYDAASLPALLAERGGELVGLLTYQLDAGGLEIVTLDAFDRGSGVGTALLAAAAEVGRDAEVQRVWLITTNDNLDALRFYQRRGMRLAALAPGAVDAARELKPEIPLTGEYGIELHDELTLELEL